MHSIIGLGLRGFLLIASAVVLGLSVTLAKHQGVDSPPPETSFGSFVGAFGLLAAIVGITSMFIESVPQVAAIAAEGLASVLFLAAGIVLALALKGISCTDGGARASRDRFENKLLNGGCTTGDICDVMKGKSNAEQIDSELKTRCVQVQADFAFQFIAFVTGFGVVLVTILTAKRSGSKVIA